MKEGISRGKEGKTSSTLPFVSFARPLLFLRGIRIQRQGERFVGSEVRRRDRERKEKSGGN